MSDAAAPTDVQAIVGAYREDVNAADARYRGRRLTVAVAAEHIGAGYATTHGSIQPIKLSAAGLKPGETQRVRVSVPQNVVFLFADAADAEKLRDGATVVLEATCDGLAPDPQHGFRLTFSAARLVG